MKSKRTDRMGQESAVHSLFVQQLNASYIDETWVDSIDIQKLLKCSESTVKRHRNEHKIPHSKIGNRYYYPLHFIKFLMLYDSMFQYYKYRKGDDI